MATPEKWERNERATALSGDLGSWTDTGDWAAAPLHVSGYHRVGASRAQSRGATALPGAYDDPTTARTYERAASPR